MRAVKVAPGATLTALLIALASLHYAADNTGEEVDNVKFIASERESEGHAGFVSRLVFTTCEQGRRDAKWD